MKRLSKTISALFILSATQGLPGCGGSGSDSPSAAQGSQASPTLTATCQAVCAKLEQCDSATDESDCNESCVLETGLSDAYLSTKKSCYENNSCNQITDGTADDCVEDAAKLLQPSAPASGFCADLATKIEACNAAADEADVRAECEEDVVVYSDALAQEASGCTSETCDRLKDCFERLEDKYHVDDVENFADGLGAVSGGGGTGGTGGGTSTGTVWLAPNNGAASEASFGIQGFFWAIADESSSVAPLTFEAAGSSLCVAGSIDPVGTATDRYGVIVGFSLNDDGSGPAPYDFAANAVSGFTVKLTGTVPDALRFGATDAADGNYCTPFSGSQAQTGATFAVADLVQDCWDVASTTTLGQGSAINVVVSVLPADAAVSFDFCLELGVVPN